VNSAEEHLKRTYLL